MNDMVKKQSTQFAPGKSGNPRGRPKGSKNKATLLKEAMHHKADLMLSRDVPKVLKVVINQALQGCTQSQKMILDRAVPAQKATDGNAVSGGKGNVQIIIKNLTAPEHAKEGTVIEGEVLED